MFQRNEAARHFGVTALENLFITEYLPAADGDKLKVYLYGLYLSQHGQEGFDLPRLAALLSMEEGQVLASLRYWERRRLVERISDKPPTYIFHHIGQRLLSGQDQLAGDEQYILFSEAVYAQLGSRRKLRESDISMAYEWVEELGLPQELVLMLLNHFADTRGANFSFKSAERTAAMMKEEGISKPEEAEQFFSHSKRTHIGARAVLAQFNMRRLPTEPELALYRKWTEQWGFAEEGILAAVAETVSANNPSFSYLNGILERLKDKLPAKKAQAVSQHLQQEGSDLAQVKQVLQELGRSQISPPTLLPAFLDLRKRYPYPMILLAAKSVQARGGMFEDLEPRLQAWQKQGLQDDKQVVAHLRALKQYEPMMLQVFEACGQEGRAGEADLLRLQGWLGEGHSQELIVEAASQARSARQKMNYIQKVLSNWKKKGITSVQAAREAEPAAPEKKRGRKLAFQDYDQEQGQVEGGFAGPDLLREAREADGK